MTMKTQRLFVILTVVNLATLAINLTTMRASAAQDAAQVLRGRSLEIVDSQGRVRASLGVLGPGQGDGRARETVLLRLITERGRPSVKIGASEESAGLSLAGPTGTRETYVILQSKGEESSLKLRNETGREQVVKPQ
jgi:hypothetical protein